jgi:hypothetical protein
LAVLGTITSASAYSGAGVQMTTRAPVNLVGGVNSATTRALLAGHQIWRATVDEDGQYLFAVAL